MFDFKSISEALISCDEDSVIRPGPAGPKSGGACSGHPQPRDSLRGWI